MTAPDTFGQPQSAPPPTGSAAVADRDTVVAFQNVTIAFDGPPVLEDVSFSVAPNETRILLGPAGVGKSVLLKLCNGLLRPDKGSIQLFGQEISTMREVKAVPPALPHRHGLPGRRSL